VEKYSSNNKQRFVFETTPERSKRMSNIKSKNTGPEIILRKALTGEGIRYRLNVAKLPGKPDIVIGKRKLIIFIDGEFWHGFNWNEKKHRIKANSEYWITKIERNMARDVENNNDLTKLGYRVLRFWEAEIKKELPKCMEIIKNSLYNK
jgi:DNA mismatch endonuclease (patch repair protein)